MILRTIIPSSQYIKFNSKNMVCPLLPRFGPFIESLEFYCLLQTTPQLFTVDWFANTEMYVLMVQPICLVRQNRLKFWTNYASFKFFRIYNVLCMCNIVKFSLTCLLFALSLTVRTMRPHKHSWGRGCRIHLNNHLVTRVIL